MKYTIYAIITGKVKMFCYALSSDSDWWGEKKVGEARTAKEASKMVKDLGQIEFVK